MTTSNANKTTFNPRGFTLVELLVVISIIAVLSVIGVVIFGGVQKSSRDARKKGDIDAIATAIEKDFSVNNRSQYQTYTGTMFSSGQVPVPPEGGSYSVQVSSDGSTFKACATLENGSYYCKNSIQGGTPPVTLFPWCTCAAVNALNPVEVVSGAGRPDQNDVGCINYCLSASGSNPADCTYPPPPNAAASCTSPQAADLNKNGILGDTDDYKCLVAWVGRKCS